MQITNASGTITLDDNANPSTEDMNDIIADHAMSDEQFQALCNASVNFPSETVAEFADACKTWVEAPGNEQGDR